MYVYDRHEPKKALTYSIQTTITETYPDLEGVWFVHVNYLTDEELVIRRVIYGPCESLIMAVICEMELRETHVRSISALFEQMHVILTGP